MQIADRVNRPTWKPESQRLFESAMHSLEPRFFEKGFPQRLRNVAMSRVLGTPGAVIQTPQRRMLYQINYVNGNTARVYSPDLPRSTYPVWDLRLTGTLSKTEVCAGALLSEGPLTLITGLRVLLDGDVVKEIDPMHLRVISHHIYRGIDTNLTNVTLGTDVAEAFSARLSLDFRTLRSETPDATFLAADRYGQLSVEVDWGSQTATSVPNLVSGGSYTGVSFPTAPTLQIWGSEILDPAIRQKNFWLQKYTQKVFSVNAIAQLGNLFQLPVGEVIRGIVVSQYTNSPRVPINTLVAATSTNMNQMQIRANGSFYKAQTSWSELIQKNQADYGIALPTGYAFFDFMDPDNGGLYNAAFNSSSGISILEALIDTASVANAFLQFTLITFKPGRNYAG